MRVVALMSLGVLLVSGCGKLPVASDASPSMMRTAGMMEGGMMSGMMTASGSCDVMHAQPDHAKRHETMHPQQP